MSGKKDSDYRLDAERTARDNALRSIRGHQQQIGATIHKTRGLIQLFPAGFASSSKSYHRAKTWVDEGERAVQQTVGLGLSQASSQLSAVAGQLKKIEQIGFDVLNSLSGECAAAKQQLRTAKTTLQSAQADLSAQAALLKQWQPEAWTSLQQEYLELEAQLGREKLMPNAEPLTSFKQRIQDAKRRAAAREAEHLRQESASKFLMVRRQFLAQFNSVVQLLDTTSPGLQATFHSEIEAARGWRTQAEIALSETADLTPDTFNERFKSAAYTLETLARPGSSILQELQEALSVTAPTMRHMYSNLLMEIESRFNSVSPTLDLWFAESAVDALQCEIDQLRSLLDADRLLDLEVPAAALKGKLEQKAAFAEGQEQKHTRRLFLLDALRRVCAELGFGEVESPTFERHGSRDSRIQLKIDTYDRGQVTFHLSLDAIEADSCVHSENCPNEFEILSDRLREQFGVLTEFRLADGNPLKRLITDDGARPPEDNKKRGFA